MVTRLNKKSFLNENIIDDCFAHIGECIGEAIALPRILPKVSKRSKKMHENAPYIKGFSTHAYAQVRKITNEHPGAIFLSGHIGPIELLAGYFVQCGSELNVIGRLPNNTGAQSILGSIRKQYGTKVIWRGEKDSPRKLLKAVKKGEVVAALIDQDTSLENEFVPSMGLDAAFPVAPIKMAVKYSIPIFACFIVRTRRRNYSIVSTQIKYDKDSPTVIKDVLKEYSGHLDALIYTYPEQWVWWHRRWRRRPGVDYAKNPEALISTSDYVEWINNIS